MFSSLLPGAQGEIETGASPYSNIFYSGLYGANGGLATFPGVPDSAIDALSAANQQYLATFSKGALSCNSPLADPSNCVPPVGINELPDHPKYPYFMQWSLGVQRQLATNWGLRVQYVGTRLVEGYYLIHPNGFQTVCDGCFAPWPFKQVPDARFALVHEVLNGANSNYSAMQVTGEKRLEHGLQFQMNYTWSHCLDTVSNGGLGGAVGGLNGGGNRLPVGSGAFTARAITTFGMS